MLFSVAIAYILFLLIRAYLFFPLQVVGPSMYPTLQDGDRLILNRLGSIDRFDVVVFPAPDPEGAKENEEYVKRIIGMPGDEIVYLDDLLYVNGEAVEEHYLESLQAEKEDSTLTPDFTLMDIPESDSYQVPEGMYFVMGDNRSRSKDSRVFGFVSEELIEGTTSLRIWPLNRAGFLEKNE
ncbi:signal peptidase I [Jeotgalibaca sp. PTS2502]|nr:signal peptidase I [Jeotgalibaca sp. PTS2502]